MTDQEFRKRYALTFTIVDQLSRMTTPTDDAKDQRDADDKEADVGEETLFSDASALWALIRSARRAVSAPQTAPPPKSDHVPDLVEVLTQVIADGRVPETFRDARETAWRAYYAVEGYKLEIGGVDAEQMALARAIDRMGWPEIHAYNADLARGQIYEDAGGYLIRCIGRLFGLKQRELSVMSYQAALRAMVRKSYEENEA